MTNRLWFAITAFVIAALSSSCATAPGSTIQTSGSGYGESKGAAIEVCHPDGERAYLARLVCPTGEPAEVDRLGTYGPRNELPTDQPLPSRLRVPAAIRSNLVRPTTMSLTDTKSPAARRSDCFISTCTTVINLHQQSHLLAIR